MAHSIRVNISVAMHEEPAGSGPVARAITAPPTTLVQMSGTVDNRAEAAAVLETAARILRGEEKV